MTSYFNQYSECLQISVGDWVLVTACITLSLKANNIGINALTFIPWIKGTILRSLSSLTLHG